MKDSMCFDNFVSVFEIFLELQQPWRLKSILIHVTEHFERPDLNMSFADFVFKAFVYSRRTMYRVFQIAFKENDQDCAAHLAKIMMKIDTLRKDHHNIAALKCIIATLLFDKGQLDLGVQGWSQALINEDHLEDIGWYDNDVREYSLARLVGYCLSDGNIPSCETFPITLDTTAESGDACLVISSWLQSHGYPHKANNVLRGRIKACVVLLSDDDPKNDEDAFKALFHTFLMDPSSYKDLDAALYCIKESHERAIKAYYKDEFDNLDSEDANSNDSLETRHIYFKGNEVKRCSVCTQETRNIHGWYYCRSCPLKTCCPECSSKNRSVTNKSSISKCPGICNDERDFLYTGGLIREAERVPEGMVPFVSSDGESNAIWIEDWKDRLVKKWYTADFTFERGLSAWCMSVLPEPQRARWAKMFKV